MARCVTSMVVDTHPLWGDGIGDVFVAACMVHVHFAPCPLDGEPATSIPVHAWTDQTRAETLTMWDKRTHRQRPLVIHNGSPADPHQHELTGDCWCEPETLAGSGS